MPSSRTENQIISRLQIHARGDAYVVKLWLSVQMLNIPIIVLVTDEAYIQIERYKTVFVS